MKRRLIALALALLLSLSLAPAAFAAPAEDFVDFCMGADFKGAWHAALNEDGSVVLSDPGGFFDADETAELEGWRNVTALEGINTREAQIIAALHADGRVSFIGYFMRTEREREFFIEDTEDWTDVKKLIAGRKYLFGLRSDGKVLCAGMFEKAPDMFTECIDIETVKSWENVRDIWFGTNGSWDTLIALFDDGTVRTASHWDLALCPDCTEDACCQVCAEEGLYDEQRGRVSLKPGALLSGDAVFVSAGGDASFCVREDGSVKVWGFMPGFAWEAESWENVAQIYGDSSSAVALLKDGTLRYSCSREFEIYFEPLSLWSGIRQICCVGWYVFGVKADGSVLVHYTNREPQPESDYYATHQLITGNVSQWTDVERFEYIEGAFIAHKADGSREVLAPDYEMLFD